jgi:chemotaxis protein methyltransferase CheR
LASILAGIELLERHHELLGQRFQRLGFLAETIDALLTAAENGETSATQKLLSLLTTKFTGFFRHPRHFELAASHALQAARQNGVARLWSAAAATGEEPWSLAIALIETFQRDDPPVRVLATDIDSTALAVAQKGEYSEMAVRSLESTRRERFFSEKTARKWLLSPTVRRLVEFQTLNLADVVWPLTGPFDVIFCRNALMYFEAGHRYAVLERIASLLVPDGLLFLDPTEHLGKAGHWFTQGAEGVYSRRRVATIPQSGRMRKWLVTRA